MEKAAAQALAQACARPDVSAGRQMVGALKWLRRRLCKASLDYALRQERESAGLRVRLEFEKSQVAALLKRFTEGTREVEWSRKRIHELEDRLKLAESSVSALRAQVRKLRRRA